MACIKNVRFDRRMRCGQPLDYFIQKPLSARFLNASEIQSYTSVGSGAAIITRVPGSVAAAQIETANNSLVVTVALKGGEVNAQVWDVSIEYSFFSGTFISDTNGAADGTGANAQIVAAVDHGNGMYRVYGLGCPLSCLSIEGSSDGNGYLRTTIGVEDWQYGTTVHTITKAQYDSLLEVAPASGGGGGDTE